MDPRDETCTSEFAHATLRTTISLNPRALMLHGSNLLIYVLIQHAAT
jgi:hypothetical protein